MSRLMFGITSGHDDTEEKIRLLETKLQSLEVWMHNEKSESSSLSSPAGLEEGQSGDKEQDKATSHPSTPPKTRKEAFEDNPPDTPTTVSDDTEFNISRSLFPTRPQMFRNPSVIEGEVDESDYYKELSEDTFTLMMLSKPFTKQWWFGFQVFLLQISLLSMIIVDQYGSSKGSTLFDVPYKNDLSVQIGQLIAIVVSLATQTDLVIAIITFIMLWTERREFWTSLIKVEKDSSLWVWIRRIAFPIACEFIEGLLVLLVTFVIVVTSDSVIDLFKDFAAMQVISELDDMMFWLALQGYLGHELAHGAKQAKKIRIHDKFINTFLGIPVRTIILMIIFLCMAGGWGYFVHGQIAGDFFHQKYPYCAINEDLIAKMGDKTCDGAMNTIGCGFDDGDCIAFNLGYPNCDAEDPSIVGDMNCDPEVNTANCHYDGGDCCPVLGPDYLDGELHGDGICHGGIFNTQQCNYDGGDCKEYNAKFSNCEILTSQSYNENDGAFPPALGDGFCNGGDFNTKHCGFDAGDCDECNQHVDDLSKIGNGHCDGGDYMNIESCNMDGNDCALFVEFYGRNGCDVPEPEKIGDGKCNGGSYNSEECDSDGGDCINCIVPYIMHVGDGWCDGGEYASKDCGFDGGDCKNCTADLRTIGNGQCDLSFNTSDCSWDGGDCLEGGRPFACNVTDTDKLYNDECDGGAYNTEECAWDNGHCKEFNLQYPNCTTLFPDMMNDGYCDLENNNPSCNYDGGDCSVMSYLYRNCSITPYLYYDQDEYHYPNQDWERLGDGTCDGGHYNTAECGFDHHDCDEFNEIYPDCNVEEPVFIGNKICDGGMYNTAECKWDGGECVDFNNEYPDCRAEFPSELGDGECNRANDNPECDRDGGDCDNTLKYPNCNVKPNELSKLGNGICDGGIFNRFKCGFDDGDCYEFNAKYQLGNGICDGGIFNRFKCGFDDGDCYEFNAKYPGCNVKHPQRVGNGECNGQSNKQECDWDGGDCIEFNEEYPGCLAREPRQMGDGVCNDYNNFPGCDLDGGDCLEDSIISNVEYPNCVIGDVFGPTLLGLLGNGICDGGEYNTPCIEFNEEYPGCLAREPRQMGDGVCNDYNNFPECDHDGGDCSEDPVNPLANYPDCDIGGTFGPPLKHFGDGICDGGEYNTPECGFDDGDCDEFNAKYPRCKVEFPEYIGDGHCDAQEYNTRECGFDDGDCDEFNEEYPDCDVDYPTHIGDGQCDGGDYNTEECDWDGGDCIEFYRDHPDCKVEFPSYIGDDACDGGAYNTEECNWDGGDCIVYNENNPDCLATEPYRLEDGYCDIELNTTECDFDGFDCFDLDEDCDADDLERIGDGRCDLIFNTPKCHFDGGDCD
eukprot:CAMPEP_0194096190 /NCGR_PEP_ID=MMETSP0149-20130528/57211_1 /TAXON_ID=122233 /ORGANISM="Chaetoceros debilis, Strain MM31A-1" /LENGTH=1350 /DNA_ID=CAMNT_0038782159 /DNA_START=274 /DNA_END=4326 /DNA_ORIENTATION=-